MCSRKQITWLDRPGEKRYRVIDVVEATGYTYGTVTGFIKNNLSTKTKEGLTLDDIVSFLRAPHNSVTDHRSISNPDEVAEIIQRVRDEHGCVIENAHEPAEE